MAATQKLYPRGTVKRIVKAHSNRSVSKNADILVGPIAPTRSLCFIANKRFIAILADIPRLHAVYARNLEVWTIHVLILRRLMREASIRSRKSGEKNISANSVRKVTEVRLVQVLLCDTAFYAAVAIAFTTRSLEALGYRKLYANSKARHDS
ncbi:hypothetical protein N7468_009815 [Penicillium chermesinum]|uniref:Uncharacterized protein n=1 Tax=Penicillium chermesinum TaxID=63820 RepID=A0A9W9NBI2_9EURO|nr:uncharacterized protein N7468_009815 [Penicillium chermesinum]KAJ5216807.1 hypothetical protein N7468_009815 [Penicillium chermesinum]